GLGFAFTNVPQAKKAVAHYREHAARVGWTPTADDVIYRVLVHVADTDEQALDQFNTAMQSGPRTGLTMANRTLEGAVADAGYYGRDRDAQRERLMPRGLKESIDVGQIALGSPDTVVRQVETIWRELGAGIIDFTIAHDMGEKTLHAIELLGSK